MASTIKVSNISLKATIKQIEEFFSFSGQIESINLTSDGDESQIAYVTFVDQDSVKIALLLSGSVILDQEVAISPCSSLETEALTAEPAAESPKAQMSASAQSRPRGINRAQDIVRTMLSRGFSLGNDTIRRAHSLDGKGEMAKDGDALKEIRNGNLHRQKSQDYKVGKSAHIVEEAVTNPEKGQEKNVACDDTDHSGEGVDSGGIGDISHKSDDEGVRQGFEENRQGKWGTNNVRMGVQKCYKHVCAINEKLQLGQKTMSVVVTAQQGVAHASSAVANNKFVSAGGGWVSSALSRVSLRPSNTSPHLNRGSGDDSASPQHEQVELTEMPTLSSRRNENE